MKRLLFISLVSLVALSFIAGLAPSSQAGTEVRLGAELKGKGFFQDAQGEAGFRDEVDRQRLDVAVTVEDLADHTLRVFLNQKFLGRIELDAFGAGELSLRSEKGEMVPMVEVGDVVTVEIGPFLVARGTFAEKD